MNSRRRGIFAEMTGYTVHTGSNNKFREGWDRVFQSKSAKTKSPAKIGKDAASQKKSRKK